MYAITLVCTDNVSLNQQWGRVLYSTEPLSQQDALLALAGDFTKQALPPGWRQMDDKHLRFALADSGTGIGAAMLEGERWRAAYSRRDLGLYPSVEAAMQAVEAAMMPDLPYLVYFEHPKGRAKLEGNNWAGATGALTGRTYGHLAELLTDGGILLWARAQVETTEYVNGVPYKVMRTEVSAQDQ